jgi:hypothetical protein
MSMNRLSRFPMTDPTPSLPAGGSPAAFLTPAGFMMCPAALLHWFSVEQRLWQAWVYQVALEQTRAVLAPPPAARQTAADWN